MAVIDNAEAMRVRAHQIWEREGRPNGREHQHWAEAARELSAEAQATGMADDLGAADAGGSDNEQPSKTRRRPGKHKAPVAAAGLVQEGPSVQFAPEARTAKSRTRKASPA